ncbi:outer membrane usher protein [Pseudomonas delhiensis]|uniref:Outer membrane usher protein n=1 Tax=Pseudomonas delhiensis TaxID=366289 RepID=A0A239KE08_9PSED|nr:fimbria/pilus outer membrane usher protein [Pseudomonas delhiensis]SDJ30760.1 outer membrane usher protein [Pseudomonas delhiensis]SNT15903.1 outer membrane usher protein [Pseudomonas delhiensis]
MTVSPVAGAILATRSSFAQSSLTAFLLGAVMGGLETASAAENVEDKGVIFNEAFLPQSSRGLDLSHYEKGNPALPGEYRADIEVNGKLISRQDIRIVAAAGKGNTYVCFERALLELVGVDVNKLSAKALELLEQAKGCTSLPELIEGASAAYNLSEQRLEISIPQAFMRRGARGYVSPELWDRGITAATLGYNLNANHNQTDFGNYDSAYLGLAAGLNLGDWRLRHNGSTTWQKELGYDYQVINTYAQRDLTSLKSQLTLGEANTGGELFDTVAYRGVSISSDERMQPESLRGYAPVIRGIARTSARVEVRQAGNLLYETNVAPGAFVIDDLYPTGYGGDLDVTVHEADGSEQNFKVPYAAVGQLLRPGTTRFSVTAGETRDNFVDKQAKFVQGTVQRGLTNSLTGYTGGQGSDDYMAVMTGLAFSTPIGALAADVTHAQTNLESGKENGQSVRLTYNKNILSTGSNFALAAYRFSTSGYMDFSNALQTIDAESAGLDASTIGRPRNRLSFTADQSLGRFGHLSATAIRQNYWNIPGTDLQYQAAYSKQFGDVSFSLSANRTRMSEGDMQNSLMLTVSMPLKFGDSTYRPQLSASVGRDASGEYNEQVTLSGTAGKARQVSYGITGSHQGASNGTSTSVNGQYIGSKAIAGGTLSQGDGYQSVSLNMSGSVIAHRGGVTLTPYQGETMALVGAEGAAGAKVAGFPGLELDSNGYAVVPHLQPYELNEVSIDPSGTSMDLELQETSQQVAPRAGAVVLLKYAAVKGDAVFVIASQKDGSPVPFGASVTDSKGASIGVVGQAGQLYARLQDENRVLNVSWGDQAHQSCVLILPVEKEKKPATEVVCKQA